MKKRTLSLLLIACSVLSLCGCSALYKKEYLSVSQYTEGGYDSFESYMCDVSDFSELKSAILRIISEHSEEERIRFDNYEGSPQSDLAQVCWEVKSETSLASYAVDYMSYDLNRIVNYYEAVFYVAYKHSEKDISQIEDVADLAELSQGLEPKLEELSNYAAFHIPNVNLVEDDVIAAITKAYNLNPASCVVMPTAQVKLHPKTGIFRIVEIELYYGRTAAVLSEMRQELFDRIDELSGNIQTDDKRLFALDAYNLLSSNCVYDADGAIRHERQLESDLGASVYGALVQGCADSQGIAAAFSALCRTAGIPCLVVSGSENKVPHFWNIIELDGTYYHVDVSADSSWGISNSFLVSDEQMQTRCWWNIEDYPECVSPEI